MLSQINSVITYSSWRGAPPIPFIIVEERPSLLMTAEIGW